MATNKHATIRYHALDQCFRNPGRKYFIEDLVAYCNNSIYEFTGGLEGVKKRQVFDDIRFMECEQGWSIPLDRVKEGKRVYYRYYDLSFSIKNQPLNETEANQLRETLTLLSRFKGMPQFEWMEEMVVRLESVFNIGDRSGEIVGFDQNRYLKGLDFFSEIFNAILYERVLAITYKGFKQQSSIEITFHPYYLKQYNNRWFLFGLNQELSFISNLALDRIENLKEASINYRENTTVDFEEYFEDAIGVSVGQDQQPERVVLKIANTLWPYIDTKPLHGSQKILAKNEDHIEVELSVIINYELISLLFSMGHELVVVEPAHLKEKLKTKAHALLKNYP
jgi:predicted DNA-binding transcriptional regulator YafY